MQKSFQFHIDYPTTEAYSSRQYAEQLAGILRASGIPVQMVDDNDEIIRQSRQPDGRHSIGYTDGKAVFLSPEGFTSETIIHEYTHIWAEAMRLSDPSLWDSVKSLLRDTPAWDQVINDGGYADIKGDEDAVASEVISRLSGVRNARKLLDYDGDCSWRDNILKALDSFWRWVGSNLFHLKPFKDISEITDRVLYDLLSGTNLNVTLSGVSPSDTLKAPNGKPSNLSREDWEYVRTPGFKEWFGDWETREFLLSDRYVSILEGDEIFINSVSDYYKAHYGGHIKRDGIGDILLDEAAVSAVGNAESISLSDDNNYLFAALPDVLQKGAVIGHSTTDNGSESYTVAAPISVKEKRVIAVVVVKKDNDGAVPCFHVHDIAAFDKLSLDVLNISDFSGVADSVPANILNHALSSTSVCIDENGEPLALYHGTSKQFDSFDLTKGGDSTGITEYTDKVTGDKILSDSSAAAFFSSSRNVAVQYALLSQHYEFRRIRNALHGLKDLIRHDGTHVFSPSFKVKSRDDLQGSLDLAASVVPSLAELAEEYRTNKEIKFASLVSSLEETKKKTIVEELNKAYKTYNERADRMFNGALANKYNNTVRQAEAIRQIREFIPRLRANDRSVPNQFGTFETYNESFFDSTGSYAVCIYSDSDSGRLYIWDMSYPCNEEGRHIRYFDELSDAEVEAFLMRLESCQKGAWESLEKDLKDYAYDDVTRVKRVFLNTRAPLSHDYEKSSFVNDYKGGKYPTEYVAARQVRKALSDGADGVVYRNIIDPWLSDTWGVFSSGQIRVAGSEKLLSRHVNEKHIVNHILENQKELNNNATFVAEPHPYGDRSAENLHVGRPDDGGRISSDSAGVLARTGDESYLRVLADEIAAAPDAYPVGSEGYQPESIREDWEASRLIALAKEKGFFIEPSVLDRLGERNLRPSKESTVYSNSEEALVYKVKDPFRMAGMTHNEPGDAVFSPLIHNLFFPESAYRFEGVTEIAGGVRLVLSQQLIQSSRKATDEEVAAFLENKGFKNVFKYSWENEYIKVTDLFGDNSLIDEKGNLIPIDPIISNKVPAREILKSFGIDEDTLRGIRLPDKQPEIKHNINNIMEKHSYLPEWDSYDKARSNDDRIFIFPDSLTRSSGHEAVPGDSWYFKAFGGDRSPINRPPSTMEQYRGLPNAFPITLIKGLTGNGADTSPLRWTDADADQFISVIEEDMERIKIGVIASLDKMPGGVKLVLPDPEHGLNFPEVSGITPESTPVLYGILQEAYSDLEAYLDRVDRMIMHPESDPRGIPHSLAKGNLPEEERMANLRAFVRGFSRSHTDEEAEYGYDEWHEDNSTVDNYAFAWTFPMMRDDFILAAKEELTAPSTRMETAKEETISSEPAVPTEEWFANLPVKDQRRIFDYFIGDESIGYISVSSLDALRQSGKSKAEMTEVFLSLPKVDREVIYVNATKYIPIAQHPSDTASKYSAEALDFLIYEYFKDVSVPIRKEDKALYAAAAGSLPKGGMSDMELKSFFGSLSYKAQSRIVLSQEAVMGKAFESAIDSLDADSLDAFYYGLVDGGRDTEKYVDSDVIGRDNGPSVEINEESIDNDADTLSADDMKEALVERFNKESLDAKFTLLSQVGFSFRGFIGSPVESAHDIIQENEEERYVFEEKEFALKTYYIGKANDGSIILTKEPNQESRDLIKTYLKDDVKITDIRMAEDLGLGFPGELVVTSENGKYHLVDLRGFAPGQWKDFLYEFQNRHSIEYTRSTNPDSRKHGHFITSPSEDCIDATSGLYSNPFIPGEKIDGVLIDSEYTSIRAYENWLSGAAFTSFRQEERREVLDSLLLWRLAGKDIYLDRQGPSDGSYGEDVILYSMQNPSHAHVLLSFASRPEALIERMTNVEAEKELRRHSKEYLRNDGPAAPAEEQSPEDIALSEKSSEADTWFRSLHLSDKEAVLRNVTLAVSMVDDDRIIMDGLDHMPGDRSTASERNNHLLNIFKTLSPAAQMATMRQGRPLMESSTDMVAKVHTVELRKDITPTQIRSMFDSLDIADPSRVKVFDLRKSTTMKGNPSINIGGEEGIKAFCENRGLSFERKYELDPYSYGDPGPNYFERARTMPSYRTALDDIMKAIKAGYEVVLIDGPQKFAKKLVSQDLDRNGIAVDHCTPGSHGRSYRSSHSSYIARTLDYSGLRLVSGRYCDIAFEPYADEPIIAPAGIVELAKKQNRNMFRGEEIEDNWNCGVKVQSYESSSSTHLGAMREQAQQADVVFCFTLGYGDMAENALLKELGKDGFEYSYLPSEEGNKDDLVSDSSLEGKPENGETESASMDNQQSIRTNSHGRGMKIRIPLDAEWYTDPENIDKVREAMRKHIAYVVSERYRRAGLRKLYQAETGLGEEDSYGLKMAVYGATESLLDKVTHYIPAPTEEDPGKLEARIVQSGITPELLYNFFANVFDGLADGISMNALDGFGDMNDDHLYHITDVLTTGQSGIGEAATVASQIIAAECDGFRPSVCAPKGYIKNITNVPKSVRRMNENNNLPLTGFADKAFFLNPYHQDEFLKADVLDRRRIEERVRVAEENMQTERSEKVLREEKSGIPDKMILFLSQYFTYDQIYNLTDFAEGREVTILLPDGKTDTVYPDPEGYMIRTPKDLADYIDDCFVKLNLEGTEQLSPESIAAGLEYLDQEIAERRAQGFEYITVRSRFYPDTLREAQSKVWEKEADSVDYHIDRDTGVASAHYVGENESPSVAVRHRGNPVLWVAGDPAGLVGPRMAFVDPKDRSGEVNTAAPYSAGYEDMMTEAVKAGEAAVSDDVALVVNAGDPLSRSAAASCAKKGGRVVYCVNEPMDSDKMKDMVENAAKTGNTAVCAFPDEQDKKGRPLSLRFNAVLAPLLANTAHRLAGASPALVPVAMGFKIAQVGVNILSVGASIVGDKISHSTAGNVGRALRETIFAFNGGKVSDFVDVKKEEKRQERKVSLEKKERHPESDLFTVLRSDDAQVFLVPSDLPDVAAAVRRAYGDDALIASSRREAERMLASRTLDGITVNDKLHTNSDGLTTSVDHSYWKTLVYHKGEIYSIVNAPDTVPGLIPSKVRKENADLLAYAVGRGEELRQKINAMNGIPESMRMEYENAWWIKTSPSSVIVMKGSKQAGYIALDSKGQLTINNNPVESSYDEHHKQPEYAFPKLKGKIGKKELDILFHTVEMRLSGFSEKVSDEASLSTRESRAEKQQRLENGFDERPMSNDELMGNDLDMVKPAVFANPADSRSKLVRALQSIGESIAMNNDRITSVESRMKRSSSLSAEDLQALEQEAETLRGEKTALDSKRAATVKSIAAADASMELDRIRAIAILTVQSESLDKSIRGLETRIEKKGAELNSEKGRLENVLSEGAPSEVEIAISTSVKTLQDEYDALVVEKTGLERAKAFISLRKEKIAGSAAFSLTMADEQSGKKKKGSKNDKYSANINGHIVELTGKAPSDPEIESAREEIAAIRRDIHHRRVTLASLNASVEAVGRSFEARDTRKTTERIVNPEVVVKDFILSRNKTHRKSWKLEVPLRDWDLSRLDLSGISFSGIDLTGVNLSDATIGRSDLRNVTLKNANLERATIIESDFIGSDLTGAILKGARLESVDMSKSILKGAIMDHTIIDGAVFAFSDCRKASFTVSTIKGVSFNGCDLRGANMWNARVSESHFDNAIIEGMNLGAAELIDCTAISAVKTGKTPIGLSETPSRGKASPDELISPPSNGFYIVRREGKEAYADEDLNIVSAFYDKVQNFGLTYGMVVLPDGRVNLVDRSGKELLPEPVDEISKASEGMIPIKKNGLWNFFDIERNSIAFDTWSGVVTPFINGLAMVEGCPEDGPEAYRKFNFVDRDNQIISDKWFLWASREPDGSIMASVDGQEVLNIIREGTQDYVVTDDGRKVPIVDYLENTSAASIVETSYWGNLKNFPDGAYVVQVSNSVPKDYPRTPDYVWYSVMPKWKTILGPHKEGQISDDQYKDLYGRQLMANKEKIKEEFRGILKAAAGRPVVMCCYEAPGKFCHRTILGKALRQMTPLKKIEEMGVLSESENKSKSR